MANLAEEEGYGIWTWPESFVNEAGQLDFDIMEKPNQYICHQCIIDGI